MTTESMPFSLVRMDLACPANPALSFKVGALSTTALCALGYVLYRWFVGG